MADVTMPQLGETVTEGTITRWFKQVGDRVEMDEILFEVSTDKVDSEVPSPIAGTLTEIFANEGDLVEVGQVLAQIGDVPAGDVPAGSAPAPAAAPPAAEAFPAPEPEPEPVLVSESRLPEAESPQVFAGSEDAAGEASPQSSTLPPPLPPLDEETSDAPVAEHTESTTRGARGPRGASRSLMSPVVRRLIADNGLDASMIAGTGIGGRITRADVEGVIRSGAQSAPPASAPRQTPSESSLPPPVAERPFERAASESPAAVVGSPPAAASTPSTEVGTRDKVVALNNIRKRTAEHMVMSKSASPHVLTAMEIDYEGVEKVRKALKSGWRAEEGFSLTYLPFIARAVVDALREYPHLNASFGGDHLVVHDEVNLAIAVDIDFNGLLAPVIKGTEGKRLRQIARDIADVADRARGKQLLPDDLSGGTFTLTNAGQYGTMMQFPIINQPQVAILSTDGVARKPVVVTDSFGNESIAIHSVGVLAMAWDHRAFDGAYAAAFLHRVKEIIETRDWEAEVR
ncbi:MAG: dihydrolipoamide acetyltransferase family protein [Acidimicrobiaceae bacterium]|nr:dihydrolipoamide acetyltransferase family protein [Acidimicrobiaceae bacterium]